MSVSHQSKMHLLRLVFCLVDLLAFSLCLPSAGYREEARLLNSVGLGHLEIDHVEVLSNQDLQDLGGRMMEGGGGQQEGGGEQQEGGREDEEEEGAEAAQTGDETQLIFYETKSSNGKELFHRPVGEIYEEVYGQTKDSLDKEEGQQKL